jgi:hypothetical protein
MNETSTEMLSVVVEREIPYPPEKIWRALTRPHLIEEWLMKNDFKPVVGHRFDLRADWGAVDCQVLAVELSDRRGKMLSQLRALIKQADPEVVEAWKWRGVPVWSHDGMICTGETYKNVVKMTFAQGAPLDDPSGLFNSSLDGNTRRAIDFHEGEEIDEEALKALIRAAVTLNASRAHG